jgi:hypothetical protein
MLGRVIDYLIDYKDRQRIAIALAKGGASRAARKLDLSDPATWEFSGFSQNGEDGIIEVLRMQLKTPNRYVVEIGAAEGTENNSSWLLSTAGYEGLMIEGDPRQSDRARRNVGRYSIGSAFVSMFVTLGTVDSILDKMALRDPDVFSLDIDGNDWHIANALFAREFRPKIVAVEYNSAFGPERSVSSRYRDDFRRSTAHPSQLYYGVSLMGWRTLFQKLGYRYVTVDSNGVNAFFIDAAHLNDDFTKKLNPRQGFVENRYQLRAYGQGHAGQFAMMADALLEQV